MGVRYRYTRWCLALFLLSAALSGAQERVDSDLAWLESNQSDPSFLTRLDEHIAGLATVEEARNAAVALEGMLIPADAAADHAFALAQIFLAAREFELADRMFAAADRAVPNVYAKFARAQLALQLSNISTADQIARQVLQATDDFSLKRRSYALIARALHAVGRHTEADTMVQTLLALDDPSLVETEAILLRESIARALGRDYSAAETLAVSHPDSVAALLSGNGLVRAAALPVRFVESHQTTATESTDPQETSDPRAVSVSGIQVGSFSDPENAEHMADDVRALALSVRIESSTRGGRTVHSVVVELDGDSSDVVRTMEILQASGFDGFLIY